MIEVVLKEIELLAENSGIKNLYTNEIIKQSCGVNKIKSLKCSFSSQLVIYFVRTLRSRTRNIRALC